MHRDTLTRTTNTLQYARFVQTISATKTARLLPRRHTHTVTRSHTRKLPTKIAPRTIAGMSYAVPTTLFDSTDSERSPRDLPRTWSIYEAGHYAFYDTPNPGERRTVPYPLRPTLRSSWMPRSLVSGRPKYTKFASSVQCPSDNETRKWRRRQNGRSADRIAYVAYR